MEITTTMEDNIKNRTIPKLWDSFIPRIEEIKNKKQNYNTLGICFGSENSKEFNYLAAVEVDNFDFVPNGMTAKIIPSYKYAVFTHTDELDKIPETYNYIYSKWLPNSNYKQVGPDFELYDCNFKVLDQLFIFIYQLKLFIKNNNKKSTQVISLSGFLLPVYIKYSLTIYG